MSYDFPFIVQGSKREDILSCILRLHIFRLWRIERIPVCTPFTECCLVLYPGEDNRSIADSERS